MGGPPICHEPTVHEVLLQDQDCEPIFRNSGWLDYFLKLIEFNKEIVREFTCTLSNGEAQVLVSAFPSLQAPKSSMPRKKDEYSKPIIQPPFHKCNRNPERVENMVIEEPLTSREQENLENLEKPGSPLEPSSSMISSEQNIHVVEEPLQEEATLGVPSQSLRKTRAATQKERGKEKQVDMEHKEEKSKSENLPPHLAKKRKVVNPVSLVTIEVIEELATRSSPAAEKGKSWRSSGRLRKKLKNQDQSTEPNITILIESLEQEQHSPLHNYIPPSQPNEPQREQEKEEELQNMEEQELQLQEGGELQNIEQPQKEVGFERLDNLASAIE
ncbi:uncharacterized protein LOC131876574 [Cryptomeria japonica]|uniref:uncharacterized protein LOC131876574 n=1 Tax=Cryptomeria japonica TaxID=3369 RepID=UPI0027DA2EEE|nr:uncharacterized protein LOC131876574 [Cryptomeria japonica]